jgi:hypothetical protein
MNLVDANRKRTYKKPCPKCGSWEIIPQMPIDVDIDVTDAKKALGQYARAIKAGATPLKGPCFIMCRACGHKGQSVDCSGRTSEDVGRDTKVFTEMKRLWIEQERSDVIATDG